MDGVLEIVELLEINQSVNTVFLREAFDDVFAMLPHASNKIVGHANIERAANPACENVDIKVPSARGSILRI